MAEVGILALLISVNLFLDFFLIRRLILDRFPGLVKRSLIESAWGWGRVRQWPLRLKFVVVLSVMMLLAGSALFFSFAAFTGKKFMGLTVFWRAIMLPRPRA